MPYVVKFVVDLKYSCLDINIILMSWPCIINDSIKSSFLVFEWRLLCCKFSFCYTIYNYDVRHSSFLKFLPERNQTTSWYMYQDFSVLILIKVVSFDYVVIFLNSSMQVIDPFSERRRLQTNFGVFSFSPALIHRMDAFPGVCIIIM